MTNITGLNAATGRSISGTAHLQQSIADILTTRIGSRIMRRSYGSQLPELIDHPNNPSTRVRLHAAIATAIMLWEPRVRLSRVQLGAGVRPGQVVVDIEGTHISTDDNSASLLALSLPLQLGAAA